METENRNVIDYYAYWTTEAIKTDLDKKRHNFSVLISNELNDFNVGQIIRNSNAFLAKEVIIYGRKKYDKRSTVGTHHYENISHVKCVDELNIPVDTIVIGIDNIAIAKPIENFRWPKNHHVMMVFGQEQVGIAPTLLQVCEQFVYINQYGSVRSLNVGCASGIAMYSYVSSCA